MSLVVCQSRCQIQLLVLVLFFSSSLLSLPITLLLANFDINSKSNFFYEQWTLLIKWPKGTWKDVWHQYSSLFMKEISIKSTVSYYSSPIRMATIENTDHTKCWWRDGRAGTFMYYWWQLIFIFYFFAVLGIEPMARQAL
jgi:hypothetical protein